MKMVLMVIFTTSILVACSQMPKESAIQTAIYNTQIAESIKDTNEAQKVIDTKRTQDASLALLPTQTERSTNTPRLTNTPRPTNTPKPTATPRIGSRSVPVMVGETISVTKDENIIFDIWVSDVIRSEDSWQILKQANQFNPSPPQGKEYVLVLVNIRYVRGPEDAVLEINGGDFGSVSKGEIIDYFDGPTVIEPEPELDLSLFPGAETGGWIAILANPDDSAPLLVFGDPTDPAHSVYFLLTP